MAQGTDAVQKCETVQCTHAVKAHGNSRSVQYILETLSCCQPCGKPQAEAGETPSPCAECCMGVGSGEGKSQEALPETQLSAVWAPPAPSPPPHFPFLLKTIQWGFQEEGGISESIGWVPWGEGVQREALPASYFFPGTEVRFGRALGKGWNEFPPQSTASHCYASPQQSIRPGHTSPESVTGIVRLVSSARPASRAPKEARAEIPQSLNTQPLGGCQQNDHWRWERREKGGRVTRLVC